MSPDWIDRFVEWLFRYSNGLEQIWTSTYAIGLVCGLAALWMANHDETWQYVYGSGSVDRLGARKEVRQERRTVYKLILGLIAGVVQMTSQNIAPHPTRAGYVTTACVAGMGLIMTYGSVRNLIDRLRIRREARRVTDARRRRYTDPPTSEVTPTLGLRLQNAGITPGKDLEP